MADTIIDYHPARTIERYIKDDNEVCVIFGPWGSGKTVGSILKILYRILNMPVDKDGKIKARWAVVRNTKAQLNDTTIRTWNEWIPESMGHWRLSEKIFKLRFNNVEADILFRALDEPADVRNVLSLELTGAFFNEVREIHSLIFTSIKGRTSRFPKVADYPDESTWKYHDKVTGDKWPFHWGVIADSNMPEEESFYHIELEQKQNPGWSLYKQPGGVIATQEKDGSWTYEANPDAENLQYLRPNYYMGETVGATDQWILVELACHYGSSMAGKAVYSNSFNAKLHVSDTPLVPNRFLPLVIGIDLGRTPAAVIKQKTLDGFLYTYEEIIGENVGLSKFLELQIIPHLQAHYMGYEVIFSYDPAGVGKSQYREDNAKLIFDEFNLVSAYPNTNAIAARIDTVEKALSRSIRGYPAYVIDARCRMLVAGFKSKYKFKQKRDGNYEATPLKNEFSHVHDANQYGDMMLDERSITGGTIGSNIAALPIERANASGWT